MAEEVKKEDFSYERLYATTIISKRLVDVMYLCPQCNHREPHNYLVPTVPLLPGEPTEQVWKMCDHPFHELIKELRLIMPFAQSLWERD